MQKPVKLSCPIPALSYIYIKPLKIFQMKVQSRLWSVLATCIMLSLVLPACRDEEEELLTDDVDITGPASGSRAELTLDSLFLYAKEIYLWNEDLPEYEDFNPRSFTQYSDEIDNLKQELFEITQFSLNPATGRAYELISHNAEGPKFSYIEENDGTNGAQNARRSAAMSSTSDDYGFALTAIAADDIRIRFVETGSPAADAGLNRGDILLKVNGQSVRADSQSDINLINNAFDEPSFTLTVEKPEGETLEVTLQKTSYTINPIFKSEVLKAGTKKVGYIAYSEFSRLSNSQTLLDEAFADFASAGVTELVVDLRYNGGGYVATAEYLINQIAPASLNGSVMYKELFNEQMQQGKADILKRQLVLDENGDPTPFNGRNATYADIDYSEEGNTFTFNKKGSLESIQDVYFIISGNTASASELVINALRPYMNVTLIGSNSFGKPVGFFGIDIDQYTIYMSNFLTANSEDEGEYYDGFEPDIPAADDVTHDFGDPEEASLSMALSLIEYGSEDPNARVTLKNGRQIQASELKLQHLGEQEGFRGMIEDRKQPRR